MKKKLYIGCALTRLPPDREDFFLKRVAEIKKELSKHFEVMEFLGVTAASTEAPVKVYTHDIKNSIMKADCMLAICDYPSLGLGYELATAVEKRGIPVLAIAHKDSRVSNLIRGIDHKNFQFVFYDSIDEIISIALKTLTN